MGQGGDRSDDDEEPVVLLPSGPHRAVSTVAVVFLVVVLAGCSGDAETTETAATTAPSDDDVTEPDEEAEEDDEVDAGPEEDDDAPSADLDPCALLTTDDLAAVTGVEFPEGEFNEALSVDIQVICDWVSDAPFATAQVLVIPDVALFEGNRSSAEEFLGGVTDIEVPGAEAAYVVAGGNVIGMAVGDSFLQVAYVPSGPDDVTEQTSQLAEIAAGNLR